MKLEIRDIEKSFGEKQVLRKISLSAESGKAVGILGRNGAGKTTTIRILMNVFPADGGEILLDGKPMDYATVKIGYLPEERGLYPKKKIIEQLVYFARLKGMEKLAAVKEADRWLKRLEMTEYRDKRLDTLSKGNQQKIQLITAVIHDPQVLILDEPFSGLDPVNAELLKEVVREEQENGKVILFSSHQMNYIEEFCDDIAILNGGTIVLSGNLTKIRHGYPGKQLQVISRQTEKIEKAFVGHCERTGADSLLIRLEQETEKTPVMKQLAEQYDIDCIRVALPTLNDIFVEYTGHGA